MIPDRSAARGAFSRVFGVAPERQVFAPGRINLIGEHIDYCGGDVLPMAINRGTLVSFRANGTGKVRAVSDNDRAEISIDIASPGARQGNWGDYLAGMVQILRPAQGIDLHVTGNIGGGGLSSSASLSVAVGYALALAGGDAPDDAAGLLDLAQAGRRSENEFVGLSCGIMDQASVALGGIIRLDCESLDFERIEPDDAGASFVVMDTRQPRALAGSKYNERVAELKAVCETFSQPVRFERLCRTLDERVLSESLLLDERLYRRLRHVLTEQGRVVAACDALKASDLNRFGSLMNQSHDSLRDDYEVTGEALDTIVAIARDSEGVLGARMTGAGFGGCAIALVRGGAEATLAARVRKDYEARLGRAPEVFIVAPDAGVRVLEG